MAVFILDDPDGSVNEFSIDVPRFPFVQPGSFAWTRHSSLICLMSSSVVKSLPAMRSMHSRPRAASRLSADAVSDPSGNASLAATERRIGASGGKPDAANSISFAFFELATKSFTKITPLGHASSGLSRPPVRAPRFERPLGALKFRMRTTRHGWRMRYQRAVWPMDADLPACSCAENCGL